ncbi:MAG: CDP-diacylglycerol--glycerol-3-phosphate 3-phosphatidyltransferase [Puniceicoccaceae bacterium]
MNLANFLTLSRIPLLFLVVTVLILDLPWAATVAFVAFVIGGLTDWADGWVARRFNQVSDFGKLMDALTDKIFTLGLFITCLHMGYMPGWGLLPLLLILTRELLITGMRLVAANKRVVLAAERSGKIKTVFQILAIGFFLLGAMLRDDFGADAASYQAIIALASTFYGLAALLTATSGLAYLRKYGFLFFEEKDGSEAAEA